MPDLPGRLSTPDIHTAFLRRINWVLFLILFLMVGGYFTWSENVGITRIIKVVSRLGMTVSVYLVYRRVLQKGAIPAFRIKNTWSPLLYIAYLVLGFISFLWSTAVGYSALQWFMDVEGLVFAFYFIRTILLLQHYFPNNPVRFYNLMGNMVFTLILVFLLGALIYPTDYFRLVEGGEDKRLGGYIMNPNELGMLCGLGVSSLIFDLYRKQQKGWTLLKILLITVALILTKSRSSLVGLLLVIFFHVRQSDHKWLKYAVYAGLVAAFPIAIEHLVMRKGGVEDILSMTGRLPFWKALIAEGLPREPWFGFGFMRIDYKDHFESVHTYAGHMTHNTFIQVLMNLGFVGLTLVLIQVAATIKGFVNEPRENKLVLLGIFIPVLINSFTEFGIFGETNYGILFYQLLIFYISQEPAKRLTPREQFIVQRRLSI